MSAAGLESDSRLQSVHSALRRYYLNEIAQPSFSLPAGTFSKGIEPSIADALELDGIEVYSSTTASGSDYVAECAAAGVPIPPTIAAVVSAMATPSTPSPLIVTTFHMND